MRVVARRALLAGAGTLAGLSVAGAALIGKPGRAVTPMVLSPAADPPARMQGMAALVRAEPIRALPAIRFHDDQGATRTLADFRGIGVVLNLWATWCRPCIAEMPSLAALARAVADAGIVVLPLSQDRGGADVVRQFYAAHAIAGLRVWTDPRGEAGTALGVRGVPTTFIVDRHGNEQALLEGSADWGAADAVATVRALVG